MAGSCGLGFSGVRLLRPGGGGQAHFPAGFSSAGGGLAFGESIHAGGKMSQSPGLMADGRPLGLGCSLCASPGTRFWRIRADWGFGCAVGAPRRRGTGTFSRRVFFGRGRVGFRGVDSRWRENEPVPGVRAVGRLLGLGCSRCASLGTRCLARSRGLGFRMCGWCAPAEGDRHIFPLGFLRLRAGWLSESRFTLAGK